MTHPFFLEFDSQMLWESKGESGVGFREIEFEAQILSVSASNI